MSIIKVYFRFDSTAEGLRGPAAWQCLKASKWVAKECVNAKINRKIHPYSKQRNFAKLFIPVQKRSLYANTIASPCPKA